MMTLFRDLAVQLKKKRVSQSTHIDSSCLVTVSLFIRRISVFRLTTTDL